jgi:hypothetical protein
MGVGSRKQRVGVGSRGRDKKLNAGRREKRVESREQKAGSREKTLHNIAHHNTVHYRPQVLLSIRL